MKLSAVQVLARCLLPARASRENASGAQVHGKVQPITVLDHPRGPCEGSGLTMGGGGEVRKE